MWGQLPETTATKIGEWLIAMAAIVLIVYYVRQLWLSFFSKEMTSLRNQEFVTLQEFEAALADVEGKVKLQEVDLKEKVSSLEKKLDAYTIANSAAYKEFTDSIRCQLEAQARMSSTEHRDLREMVHGHAIQVLNHLAELSVKLENYHGELSREIAEVKAQNPRTRK